MLFSKYLYFNSNRKLKIHRGFRVIIANIEGLAGKDQHEFTEEKFRKQSETYKPEPN